MVISQRESNISTNIRAIIEQLKLNPMQRRRFIDRDCKNDQINVSNNSSVKLEIGVYGCNNTNNCGTESRIKKNIDITDKYVSVYKSDIGNNIHNLASATMIMDICRKNDDNQKIETDIETTSSHISVINTSKNKQIKNYNLPSKTAEMRQRIPNDHKNPPQLQIVKIKVAQAIEKDAVDKMAVILRVDLPEFEGPSLNHTAAHHRISVRPKNRRPPRRTTASTINMANSIPSSTITSILENVDTLDSLETKTNSLFRKSSTQLSKSCDVFDKIETKLPTIPVSVTSLSPDSLEISVTKIDNCVTENDEDVKFAVDKSTNRITKNSQDETEITQIKVLRKPSSPSLSPSSSSHSTSSPSSPSPLSSPSSSSSVMNEKIHSTDSLVNLFSKSPENFNKSIPNKEVTSSLGSLRNYISKSTDGFDRLSEQLEVKPMPKRFTSKSTEAFDNFNKPIIFSTRSKQYHSGLLTNITQNVSKSSDSIQTSDTLLISDDSIEQRRSSFEIRPKRNVKVMSISSENFDAFDKTQQFEKRSSITDVHLSNVTHHSRIVNKAISKSTENFETVIKTNSNEKKYNNSVDKHCWRRLPRIINSESSDNLEFEDHVKNGKVCKQSRKIHSSNIIDVMCKNDSYENSIKSIATDIISTTTTTTSITKPSRLQISSESSDLGSTDTLDSDKRNKLFDSTETIDSLEKEENDGKNDQSVYYRNSSRLTTTESISDASNVNNSNNGNNDKNKSNDNNYKNNTVNPNNENNGENVENTTSFMSNDKSYWNQKSDSKENIDIHQLLAITIVSRMTDNSNNQRNSVSFPNKNLASSPNSPMVPHEGNKLLFNNLLVNKNDEELQNMLNGNISEVSTDTKSFKEKLIMFEKLGK